MTSSSIFSNLQSCYTTNVEPLIPHWKHTASAILKIALHILIPFAAVCMAHWIIPAVWAPVAVPLIGVASVAGSFFSFKLPDEPLPSPAPVILPFVPVPLPPGAPRGIANAAANCWVNSLTQMIDASPPLKQWLLSDQCPPDLFPFKQFMQAYDHARARGLNVVPADSQALRVCLAGLMRPGVGFASHQEEDPTEGWMAIHNLLPQQLKSPMQQIRYYVREEGQPVVDPLHTVRCVDIDPTAYLSVAISGSGPTLQTLMEAHCNPGSDGSTLRILGSNHRLDKETLRFVSAPPSLWIHFSRFTGTNKITTPIDLPEQYDLQLLDGSISSYELTSLSEHIGQSVHRGHCVSYRKGQDGLWYRISDSHVQQISRADFEQARKNAYFVNYSRKP